MNQNLFNNRDRQLKLPAKEISKNKFEVKEIVLSRIKKGFYDKQFVNNNVADKLILDLLRNDKNTNLI